MGERLAEESPVDADVVIRRARLRHAGGGRLCAGERHPVRRGPGQEPLRRPHVHPARPGRCASAASSSSSTRFRSVRRPAEWWSWTTRSSRLDDPQAGDDAVRGRRASRCICASLRRSSRRASTASTWPSRKQLSPAGRSVEVGRSGWGATSLAYLSLDACCRKRDPASRELLPGPASWPCPTRYPDELQYADCAFRAGLSEVQLGGVSKPHSALFLQREDVSLEAAGSRIGWAHGFTTVVSTRTTGVL